MRVQLAAIAVHQPIAVDEVHAAREQAVSPRTSARLTRAARAWLQFFAPKYAVCDPPKSCTLRSTFRSLTMFSACASPPRLSFLTVMFSAVKSSPRTLSVAAPAPPPRAARRSQSQSCARQSFRCAKLHAPPVPVPVRDIPPAPPPPSRRPPEPCSTQPALS